MTFMENENGTLSEMSEDPELDLAECPEVECEVTEFAVAEDDCEENVFESICCGESKDIAPKEEHTDSEISDRAEYDKLMRTRFKKFFAEDTQKIINKRFKRYKTLVEKVGMLENAVLESQKREEEFGERMRAECERVELETERRMLESFRHNRGRARENATAARTAQVHIDVSRLTRSQRANLASRAFKGEKIQL